MSKKLRKGGCTGTSWLRRIEEIFWGRPVLPVVLMVMVQVAERESGRVPWWTLLVLPDPPTALLTNPQSRVSFLTQNPLLRHCTMMEMLMVDDAARFETSPMTPAVLTKAMCLFAGLQMLIRGIRQRSIKSNVSSANKPTLSEGTCRKMIICTSATLSNTPTQSSSEIVLMFVSHSPPTPSQKKNKKRIHTLLSSQSRHSSLESALSR